jgi:hypothetical protein
MRTKIQSGLILAAFTIASALGGTSAQAKDHGGGGVVVVSPSNMQGWSCVQPTADTRGGGLATFVVDPTAPSGAGALQLTTDADPASKVQCVHSTNTPLSAITELSYWTKQNPPTAPLVGDPAYELATCLNGGTTSATCGFTTLVFEPYQNPTQGAVLPSVWQQWDVDAGLFWSTRTVVCSNGTILGTPGGPATYTLAQVNTICPEALVFQFLVNVGSNNPLYTVETDLFNFNGTVYDFEPVGCGKDKKDKKDDHDNKSKPCQDKGGDNSDSD